MLENDQIRRRIIINSGTMAASRGVSAAFSLVLVPIVIAKLGVVGFGTWEMIFSMAMICSMIQSATVNTLLWQISNAYGTQNENKVRRILQIGITVTLVQFIVILPFIWVFRQNLVTVFHVPQGMIGIAAVLMPIFCGMMILNGISECVGTIISGYQRTGSVTMVQSLAQVLNYCVSIGFLLSGFGLLSMFIGYTINYLLVGISYFIMARRLCPRLSLLPVLITFQETRNLYQYFSLMLIGAISGTLRDEKDRMVLATYYSPEWTGYYSVSLRLVGFITLMNNFFYVPVLTAVGAINARGDWNSINRIYSNTISIVAVVVGFMAVMIAGLHERFVALWIGRDIPEVGLLITWLVIGNITAILLTGPGTAICKGIGRMGMEASYWGLGIIFNLILTLVLIEHYGAIGSVAASSLSWAISSAFFLWLLHSYVNLSWKVSIRSIKVLLIIFVSVVSIKYISSLWSLSVNRPEALWQTFSLALIAFVGYMAALVGAKIIPFRLEHLVSIMNRKARQK